MKTIRISRQGFSLHGMHSWMKFFIFVLSKKYNVIVDPINPDLIVCSNLYHYKEGDYDTFLKAPSVSVKKDNLKFLYVSGEVADFASPVRDDPRLYAIGYQKFEHPKYFRMPSYVIDAWTLFDEARIYDTPFNWLLEKRNYEEIINKQIGFCSVTQASNQPYRGIIFDKLQEYKIVSASGPWRQNIPSSEGLDKYKWLAAEYIGRNDGLTYREKIDFFRKYKFNIAIHLINMPHLIQEKLLHAYVGGAVPIFHGNQFILEEGFNPNTFINLHNYENNLDEFLELVKRIDNDNALHKSYIEEPIFINNKLPDYFNIDNILAFLEKVVES